jgi:predicted dehydrogenase
MLVVRGVGMTARTRLGVGVIGTGWMARAHVSALRRLDVLTGRAHGVDLVVVAGRDAARTSAAAATWGFRESTDDWERVVAHPDVDVVVNLASNAVHAPASIAALAAGRHVVCEKPLATRAEDVAAMVDAAAAAPTLAVASYNYRFVPALQFARRLLRSGELGALRSVSLGYEQDWASRPVDRTGWRFDDPIDGSVVFDLSHVLDLLRWLVGEPRSAVANVQTLSGGGVVPARVGTDPEDSYAALFTMEGGVTADVRVSRIATGRKGDQFVHLTGSLGALRWSMEDLNSLELFLDSGDDQRDGFRRVLVTEPGHPLMANWYAPGHVLGWDDTVLHEWVSISGAIADGGDRSGDLATFADGAQAFAIADAVRRSSRTLRWESV